MFYYDRIDVFERVGLNKINEAINYLLFVIIIIILQNKFCKKPKVCNDCHELRWLSEAKRFNDIGTIPVKGNDHRVIFCA